MLQSIWAFIGRVIDRICHSSKPAPPEFIPVVLFPVQIIRALFTDFSTEHFVSLNFSLGVPKNMGSSQVATLSYETNQSYMGTRLLWPILLEYNHTSSYRSHHVYYNVGRLLYSAFFVAFCITSHQSSPSSSPSTSNLPRSMK